MGVTDKVWGALTSMIKLEDKVNRQAEAMKAQQQKIEDLRAGGYVAASSSTTNESLTETGLVSEAALFTRSWTVANGAVAGTKSVAVTVSWTDMHGAHQVLLQSLLAQ